jgi:hypothetical protein
MLFGRGQQFQFIGTDRQVGRFLITFRHALQWAMEEAISIHLKDDQQRVPDAPGASGS